MTGRRRRGSDYYDEYWARGSYPDGSALNPPLMELISSHARVEASALDVGCGNGRAAGRWLAPQVRDYTGVDVSAVAVDEARSLGLDAHVIRDAADLPFADDSFDLVICIEVLEHLLRPDHAAEEMLRVLRPGGTLIATVPNIVFWRRRLDALFGRWNPLGDELSVAEPWRDPHLRFFTPARLEAMIEGAGFEQVTIGGHDGAFLKALPVVRKLVRKRPRSSPLYRALERRRPALLSTRVNCVATKLAGA